MQNTVCNMLDNSSFEVATDWTPISQAVTGTASSDEAYIGTKSLKMERAGDGDSSGFQSQEISLPKGETYTFSGYVKTVGGKACLVLTNGTHSEYSMYLPKNSDWTRLEVSYTNDTATAINIYARVETENAGTTYLDCVQLEHTPTASRYNLIQNGDFSRNTDWSYSEGLAVRLQLNDDTDPPKVPAPQLDGNVYKMTGVATRTNRITQTVAVSGKAGDTFIIAGWGRGNSVPLDMDDTNPREFAILATFNYTDGTTQTKSAKFNPYVSNWQHASEYLVAEKNFSSITVELAYDYNANAAWFDGIQLFREEYGIQYDYTDGNITSITDILGQKTTYTYYPNNVDVQTATSYVNDTAVTTTYEYDSYHNVISSTSSATPGLSYSYSYDDYGRLESTTVTYGGVSITSETSETIDNQNRLVTATDPAGNTTTYVYDKDTNELKSVHYPNDGDDASRNIIYGYDSMCRLTSVSKVLSENVTLSVAYEYELDMLTEIQTGSTAYTFDYGSFGLRHSIQIGERTLATYGYTERTNYLSSLDYGNGDSVDYMYDTQGRLTRQTYEDGDTVTYAYDNSGYLASVMDSDSGITTRYHYDFADRLVMFTDGNSDFSRRVQFFYNERNQMVTKSEFYGDVRHNTYYNYDRNGRQTMVDTSLSQRRFAYDGFSRLSQRTSTYDGTAVLTETFGYDSGNRISTLTKLLVDDGVSSTVTHSYTYDGNGNITSVTVGDESTRYTYDSANQLIREDNPYTEKTYVWTYDNAGNITKREEYVYTTAANPGNATSTVHYTYGDTDWGDLLKYYDGQQITYDTIGNPTSYYNGTRWTMTWEHGRELRTISNGSTTWTNTYNADGLRTKRTNGTTTYRYRYTDGLLATMNIDDDVEMWFMYDGNGPMVLKYDDGLNQYGNVEFHYELNLQGDVVAIISSRGERVVEYTYDAWGNVIDITGSAKDTIGVHNPLRYRGYVYDTETGFYYLLSRYYDPKIGRFINADVLVSTGQDLLGNNMFAYCGNNPVNKADPKGTVWVCVVGAVLFTAACLNNENQMAYEASSGKSNLSSTSYSDGSHKKLTRQEKMDYTKQQTGDSKYTTNAWRFQAEYTLHEIGWNLTGWAYDKKIPIVSNLANKFISAEVNPHDWDERWYVNVGTVIVGLLGL